MVGVDNSAEMLEIAGERQEEEERNDILYLLQDMRELELFGNIRAIVSVCDSMNYILEPEDLKKVFERIEIGSKDDFGNPYEEWFISDYDCYVDGLYEMLGEYESLDELNYLAFFKKKPVIFFYEK